MSQPITSAEPDLSEELVRKLKTAARSTGALAAAQVQYLNINDLAARSGRHWPAVNDRIRSGSLSYIRSCVDADDLVIPCDDGFLVFFTEGDSARHAQRAQELQSMLAAFYFGEEGLENLQVQVDPRELSGDDIRTLVNNKGSSAAALAPEANAQESAHDIVFWPVWAAQAELIALHLCAPNYCDQGVVRHGYDKDFRLGARHSGADFAQLDLTILQNASAALARLLMRSPASVVGATVHVTTLRRRQALGDYLRALQAIPEPTRQRMVVKIAEIEPGTPTGSLTDWTSLLRQHVRHVALGFHHSERAFDRLRHVGVWSAGADLPPHGPAPSADTKRSLHALIKNWTRAAGLLAFACTSRGSAAWSCLRPQNGTGWISLQARSRGPRCSNRPKSSARVSMITITEIETSTPTGSGTDWTSLLRHHVRHVALDFHDSERTLSGAGTCALQRLAHMGVRYVRPSSDTGSVQDVRNSAAPE